MIDTKEISVIVQGAINKTETPKCVKSIRKYLPDAEIILSTWEGTDTSKLDFDKVIYNKDPGTTLIEEHKSKKIYNNMNRQLLSTQAGLAKVQRKYTLKLRSDLILSGTGFIDYFDKFQQRIDEYKLFKRKIVTSTLFTRFNIKFGKQYERVKIPFHISDWWLFGLREDLNKYFLDTPLVKEPEFTNYFSLEENKSKNNPYGKAMFKFAPEQYFGYECFARNFDDIYMEDAADYSDELMEKFRKCLVNNFIILEFEQSGIYLNKYPYSKNEKFFGELYLGLYNNFRFETEYKKFCDPNYKTSFDDSVIGNLKIEYALLRIYKHISVLTNPQTPLPKKLEQIFLSIPLTSIAFIKEFIVSKILK